MTRQYKYAHALGEQNIVCELRDICLCLLRRQFSFRATLSSYKKCKSNKLYLKRKQRDTIQAKKNIKKAVVCKN